MIELETDYLVIGSGAISMAFVDTMLDQSNANFIIVDKHHLPGGHWNDAYSFVRLHQPSALYGVSSTELGTGKIDQTGPNKGFYELASGPELLAYFEKVMVDRLLASGRVKYLPLHEYKGGGKVVSLLSDDTYQVKITKYLVDGTFFNTSVPSTHTRNYKVNNGVTCVAPNDLPKLAHKFSHFCIVGGGKTAMDTGVWLLSNGAKPDSVSWVCPRDSWLINRNITQPGKAFFKNTAGAVFKQFEAMLNATSIEDLFLRLEQAGNMLRINQNVAPTMFHYATISEGEVEHLSRITQVIRGEYVAQINSSEMIMKSDAAYSMPSNTLYIDCTATAAVFTGERVYPVFSEDKIVLQAVYAPLVTYSAAIIAYVEANYGNNLKHKNQLCTPVMLADTPQEWIGSTTQNTMNQTLWNQDANLRVWLNSCRLNPSYAAFKENAMADASNAELMKNVGKIVMPAIKNVQKLLHA